MVETKRAMPSTAEVGYVNGKGNDWHQWDDDEKVPELQWPDSVHVYSRMMKEDGRVTSVLQAIGLLIRRTAWRIDPNGADPKVVEFIAQNLGLPIVGTEPDSKARSRGRFSWQEHLQTVLLMLPYGHSFFEQVYRVDENDVTWLHKLAPRPQKTISKINVALDGGLESIEQSPPAGPLTVASMLPDGFVIDVSRLVAYVRDPEPGEWIGTSLLRPAYKHWILKDEFMRIQAATAKRNGMGVPVGTASSNDQGEVDKMQELASSFRGSMHAGVGLAEGQTMQLLGVNGNLPDMGQAIEYHDKQIALAALAHFLNLDKGGSFALASVQEDMFVQSVQTVAESIANTANAHIIEDLVDINFGESEAAPRIVFDEIGSRQDATAASLALLVQNGLLEADEALKIAVRQNLGLPTNPKAAEESTT